MHRKPFPTIPAGTQLVTANQRLALHLQKLYPEQTKQIDSLEGWLLKLSHKLLPELHILSETEATYLWQRVLSQSLSDHPLLQVTSTAKLAQSAWLNLQLWQRTLDELDRNNNLEVEQFIRWSKAFQKACAESKLLCPVQIPAKLLELRSTLKLPQEILLIGFDELTPLHRHFFAQLDCKISFMQTESKSLAPQISVVELPNSVEELYLMARWAKACLIENAETTVACIVPELNNLRNQVIRIFSEIFDDTELDFNLSSARSLLEFNFIRTALQALNLKANHNDWQDLSELLNSAHLNSELSDRCMAAETDLALREHNHGKLAHLSSITSILVNLKNAYPDSSFSERWQAWQSLRMNTPLSATPAEWAQYFQQELSALGWANKTPQLSSEEHELLYHWNKIFEDFTLYARHSAALTREEALQLLKHLTQATLYQTSNKTSRLQILGILEASALNFSAMWVMGLNDRSWPPAAHPNPLIPYYQQRAWLMPHASTERELDYCQKIQERLLNSAEKIILSFAKEDRNLTQGPSALITDYPTVSATQLAEQFTIPPYTSKSLQIFAKRRVEFITDSNAPILGPNELIRGGSFIVKEQALCPFRAFAKLRLNTFSLSEPELGLSPITRGILVHKALEHFWRKIKTQAALIALSEIELHEKISRAVYAALAHNKASAALLKIEASRLMKLLYEWLNFEKQRPPFKLIAEEAAYQIELASLKLNLRIDRIDQLEDGTFLIIDYKTGNSSVAAWFEERITEPQLPLYAAFAFTHATAIALAQLQKGQMKLKGISAEQTEQSGLVPLEANRYNSAEDWESLVGQWRHYLTKTADDFCSGKASVDPHNQAITCKQCDLQALCRINDASGTL